MWCLIKHVEVEEKYKGPRFDGEITAEFMKETLDWFRDQKLLHKKYAFKACIQDQSV